MFLNDYKLYEKSHHQSCVTKIGVLQNVNLLYLSNFLKKYCELLHFYYSYKPTTYNSIKKWASSWMFCNPLKAVSATFASIKMFKKQSLSFYVVSKTFITQNYLFVIPGNILRFSCLCRSFLAHFKPRDNRGKHDFQKQYNCGNNSDDVYQCLKTDQILLKIQYFDHNTL